MVVNRSKEKAMLDTWLNSGSPRQRAMTRYFLTESIPTYGFAGNPARAIKHYEKSRT